MYLPANQGLEEGISSSQSECLGYLLANQGFGILCTGVRYFLSSQGLSIVDQGTGVFLSQSEAEDVCVLSHEALVQSPRNGPQITPYSAGTKGSFSRSCDYGVGPSVPLSQGDIVWAGAIRR